ncbi:MAG TPA: pitrilysin family protein [Gemmatimonadales bacterium]
MRLLLTMLLSGLPAAAGAQATEGIFPFPYHTVRLDNGFTAYVIRAGAPGQIAFVSMVRTGSRDEVEPGKSGFAHFFEHMMFRGTERYPNYDGITAAMGAARNAFTSSDMTVYYLVAASEYLEQILDLESDRFRNLRYAEPDFRTEAGAVLGEYQQSATTPFGFLNEKVRETAYDQHTYRHTTIGFEADVRAMPEGYDYSLTFYRRFYRPENVVLVIAGDVDPERAEALIRRYYRPWEPGYSAPDVPAEPAQAAARARTVEYPGRTLPVLSLNWKGPAWSARDRLAVATEVLGRVAFGSNSDLYRRLVIRDRLVQSLSAGFGLQRDPALLSVTATVTDPAQVDAVATAVHETVQRFQAEPPDAQPLADTKRALKYGFLMGLETAQSVAFAMIPFVVNTGGVEAVEDYYRTLDAVTADDVRAAARRYLVDPGLTVVTMVQGGAR